MSEKELTEAALAENIFRITHWNWLKPKKSKIIVTVFDFQKKNKDVQCKDFWMFLVEASQKFAFSKSFGREIIRIGFIKLAQTCCVSFSKLFAWFLFGYWQIWKLMSTRCKGNDWNWVKAHITSYHCTTFNMMLKSKWLAKQY